VLWVRPAVHPFIPPFMPMLTTHTWAVGAFTEVVGAFPATFRVDMYDEPSPIGLDPSNSNRAEGRIVAVRRNEIYVPEIDLDHVVFRPEQALLGAPDRIDASFNTTQYRVAWLREDLHEGDSFLGVSKAGYHLIEDVGGRLVRYCTFDEYSDCMKERLKWSSGVADDEAYCRAPHQILGTPKPVTGGLDIKLADRPLFMTMETAGGYYEQELVPKCN
jgi:hypothetical protein